MVPVTEARIVGRFGVGGPETRTAENLVRQYNQFAVTLPSTPADQGEQRRTVTNAYSQVAGMHEYVRTQPNWVSLAL
jgi:hypothetical protein